MTRGRPPGRTQDKQFIMRVDDAFFAMVDGFRFQQEKATTRAQAVRLLMAAGLEAEAAKKKGGRK